MFDKNGRRRKELFERNAGKLQFGRICTIQQMQFIAGDVDEDYLCAGTAPDDQPLEIRVISDPIFAVLAERHAIKLLLGNGAACGRVGVADVENVKPGGFTYDEEACGVGVEGQAVGASVPGVEFAAELEPVFVWVHQASRG